MAELRARTVLTETLIVFMMLSMMVGLGKYGFNEYKTKS